VVNFVTQNESIYVAVAHSPQFL